MDSGVHQYNDIIHLPHHVSEKRPQMPMEDRAAQFLPFAALTGYDAAIRETARLTDDRMELSESELSLLDGKLQVLTSRLGKGPAGSPDERPAVDITYFKPDERKTGGAYIQVSGNVKKVDHAQRVVVLEDGTQIPMEDILDID